MGAGNLPLYPERKREELNVENADGLKKSCRPADNAVYWYRRECRLEIIISLRNLEK